MVPLVGFRFEYSNTVLRLNICMVNSQIIAKEKRIIEYNLDPNRCTHCNNVLEYRKKHLKFCNHSCSATYINSNKDNNLRKHPKKECPVCKTITTNAKYCCKKCAGIDKTKYDTPEEGLKIKRARGRESYARYAAKKKYQTPVDADLVAIKEFYKNCPSGYEVDHIIPISKGGLHSLPNLQYLTSTDNKRKNNKLNWSP